MKSNAIIWLLLALIFGLYSAYIFSTIQRESPWSIISESSS
ncbi:hypothetical protein AB0323_22315 [Arthrobacter sp. NPDC080031]